MGPDRNKHVRNIAIILALTVAVWKVPGGGTASQTIANIFSVLFLAGLFFLGYRVYMERRETLFSLEERQRGLLYGALATVSSFTVSGAVCDLGVTGAQVWPSVPAGNLWFVLVADDNATTEGSWGSATSGPRVGTAASGLCSAASRTNAGTCP